MSVLEFGNICENIFKSKLDKSRQHEFVFMRTDEDKQNLNDMLRGKNCDMIPNNYEMKKTCELITQACETDTNGCSRIGPFNFCANIKRKIMSETGATLCANNKIPDVDFKIDPGHEYIQTFGLDYQKEETKTKLLYNISSVTAQLSADVSAMENIHLGDGPYEQAHKNHPTCAELKRMSELDIGENN